ncbi:MAG TPA: hypothetical protein VF516_19095, partial [Kofleriaceae bacterium]
HEVNLKSNNWWRGRLRSAYYFHEDFARSNDLEAALRRVTSAHIKASAARFLDENNLIVGILRPAADAAPATKPVPIAVPPGTGATAADDARALRSTRCCPMSWARLLPPARSRTCAARRRRERQAPSRGRSRRRAARRAGIGVGPASDASRVGEGDPVVTGDAMPDQGAKLHAPML